MEYFSGYKNIHVKKMNLLKNKNSISKATGLLVIIFLHDQSSPILNLVE
jgi:hypothetical protein